MVWKKVCFSSSADDPPRRFSSDCTRKPLMRFLSGRSSTGFGGTDFLGFAAFALLLFALLLSALLAAALPFPPFPPSPLLPLGELGPSEPPAGSRPLFFAAAAASAFSRSRCWSASARACCRIARAVSSRLLGHWIDVERIRC